MQNEKAAHICVLSEADTARAQPEHNVGSQQVRSGGADHLEGCIWEYTGFTGSTLSSHHTSGGKNTTIRK